MTSLAGIHHVKLPVSDAAASRDWYQRTLGLELDIEFVEDGRLVGVALRDPGGTLCIALRADPERVAAMDGFDPVALGVSTREEIEHWRDRLDRLGEAHGGIVRGHQGWALIGLHDPDGIEIRLYTRERHDNGGS